MQVAVGLQDNSMFRGVGSSELSLGVSLFGEARRQSHRDASQFGQLLQSLS